MGLECWLCHHVAGKVSCINLTPGRESPLSAQFEKKCEKMCEKKCASCQCIIHMNLHHVHSLVSLLFLLLLNLTFLLSGIVAAQCCLDLCFVCQVSLWLCQRKLSLGKLSLT